MRGHTVENKMAILKEVQACKIQYIVVAAFSMGKRVDDDFVAQLVRDGVDMSKMFAFSEDADSSKDGHMLYGEQHIPVALRKMKDLGVQCPIIEIDVADKSIDWDGKKGPAFDIEPLIKFLLTWSKDNLCKSSRFLSFINIRDFPIAMCECPTRTLKLVATISKLPKDIRPMGILIEEPMGVYFPDECARWVRAIRTVMDSHGFCSNGEDDGLLVTHVHKQWGMADAVVLDALAAGSDGIWCSICEEGAAQGHSCSAVTLANLGRLGNKDVRKYETANLANAARIVTEVTTGKKTHPRQAVYGKRAIEAVFDFGGIAGSATDLDSNADGKIDEMDRFSLARFLGVEDPPVRITTLASTRLIVKRLQQLFGEQPQFTEELGAKMQKQIQSDLCAGSKQEYTSILGMIELYKKATDDILPIMHAKEKEAARQIQSPYAQELLQASKDSFVDYARNDMNSDYAGDYAGVKSSTDIASLPDDEIKITYKSFYTGYLQEYFGCYTCDRTKEVLAKAMEDVDTDHDGSMSWDEWRSWLYWALQEYPQEIEGRNIEEKMDALNDVVISKAIIPNFLHKKAGALPSGRDAETAGAR
jgi:hypothetical protein